MTNGVRFVKTTGLSHSDDVPVMAVRWTRKLIHLERQTATNVKWKEIATRWAAETPLIKSRLSMGNTGRENQSR